MIWLILLLLALLWAIGLLLSGLAIQWAKRLTLEGVRMAVLSLAHIRRRRRIAFVVGLAGLALLMISWPDRHEPGVSLAEIGGLVLLWIGALCLPGWKWLNVQMRKWALSDTHQL